MKTPEQRRKQLMDRLKELSSRLHEIELELAQQGSEEREDLAIDREDDEVLEDLSEAAIDEVRAIRAALRRIDKGEYGYCTRCGAKISEERLDLIPQTPFCSDCAHEVADGA